MVYEAEHVELGRKVALKVLAPGARARPRTPSTASAARRARWRSLSHPNLVALYDFGKSLDGRVFLAMELLAGETLDKRARRAGALDWREAVRLASRPARRSRPRTRPGSCTATSSRPTSS